MAADPYTGIVAMWADDVLEGAEFHRLLPEMRRPTGWPAYDEPLLVGSLGAIGGFRFAPFVGQIPTEYLEAVTPAKSNKWADNPLCQLNRRIGQGKKRGR